MKAETVKQIIQGPAGDIEVRVKAGKDAGAHSKVVVLSHPHPLYGGTMDNKVITTLERAFSSMGYVTVAFNFRGVGKSSGEYDNGVGEQGDLQSVVSWAKLSFSPKQTVLAGFSFGSYVSLKAFESCEGVDALCTVAPPVGLYDFSCINNVQVPWTLIQGGKDEVVSAPEILDWAMQQQNVPDVYWRAEASHFFHGELVWLRKIVEASF